MPYTALDTILQGRDKPVEAGEQVPESFTSFAHEQVPNDFDRLVALGVVKKKHARSE